MDIPNCAPLVYYPATGTIRALGDGLIAPASLRKLQMLSDAQQAAAAAAGPTALGYWLWSEDG